MLEFAGQKTSSSRSTQRRSVGYHSPSARSKYSNPGVVSTAVQIGHTSGYPCLQAIMSVLVKRKTKTTWFGKAVTVFKHEHKCKALMTCLQVRSLPEGRGTSWTFLAFLQRRLGLPFKGSLKCHQETRVLGLHRTQRWILSTWLLAAEAPVARRGSPLPLCGRYSCFLVGTRVRPRTAFFALLCMLHARLSRDGKTATRVLQEGRGNTYPSTV